MSRLESSRQYENRLAGILEKHPIFEEIFSAAGKVWENYYLGAGFVTQTVWNELAENEFAYGIGDADIIYYEQNDLSPESEKEIENQLRRELSAIPFKLDIKNQARVHLWYEEKFGFPTKPYSSLEEAIDTWPTTASAIGVKKNKSNYEIYAPYGLEDLFTMTVRPNKLLVSKEVYEAKAYKWKSKWPGLKIIDW
ncbi:nucleotidyltransferase family protein [Metabacillus sp. 84]|uniref:nucleotidyltransferase family protein n=1 Tax=unclassified Metabacillus TaxID=2675274 RepID=UPI003CF833B3